MDNGKFNKLFNKGIPELNDDLTEEQLSNLISVYLTEEQEQIVTSNLKYESDSYEKSCMTLKKNRINFIKDFDINRAVETWDKQYSFAAGLQNEDGSVNSFLDHARVFESPEYYIITISLYGDSEEGFDYDDEPRIYDWGYCLYENSIHHSQGVKTLIKKINKELLEQACVRACATLRTENLDY
tara:strand:- start:439 stop:990 length:552 start_codon:yes stop_codon:yes gene_type:complete